MEAFRKLLVDPTANPVLVNNIGVQLGLEGRYEDAAKFMEAAISLAKNVAAFKVNLAIVKVRLADHERAFELLEEANSVDPSYTRTQAVLCDLLTTSLQHKEAVRCFEGRRAREGELDATSVSNYAMSLMETGQLESAVRLLKGSAISHPNNAGVLNALAVGLYRSQEYPQCVDVLTKLVERYSNHSQYRFNLTMALMAAKERNEAIEQYNLLKRSDPELARKAFEALFGNRIVDAGRPDRF